MYDDTRHVLTALHEDKGVHFINSQSHYPNDALPEDVRLPSDTPKRQMFLDLGLTDWKQELDDVRGSKLADLTLAIHTDPRSAARKVDAAMVEARRLQQESLAVVGKSLG